MREHGIEPIDLVVVNLYPFRETVAKPGVDARGGDRADRHRRPVDAALGGEEPRRGDGARRSRRLRRRARRAARAGGEVSAATNRRLAQKVFHTTARYDGAIADYLGAEAERRSARRSTGAAPRRSDLRYGENPHQHAALYGDFLARRRAAARQGAVVQQHRRHRRGAGPGAASSSTTARRRSASSSTTRRAASGSASTRSRRGTRAFATDPESPFGGIVISTKPWTLRAGAGRGRDLHRGADRARLRAGRARAAHEEEEPPPGALAPRARCAPNAPAVRGVVGGLLVQDADRAVEEFARAKVVTRRAPTAGRAARRSTSAGKVVKHVKSNAIVFAAADRTLALGGGQTSRVEPVRNAVRARAARVGISLHGSVLAATRSSRSPTVSRRPPTAGATAIVQPGGSARDDEVIAAADARGVAMVVHRRAPLPALSACASWSSAAAGASMRSSGSSRAESARRGASVRARQRRHRASSPPACPIAADDVDGLLALRARAERIDLTVVGPELPLTLGIVDRFADGGAARLRSDAPRRRSSREQGVHQGAAAPRSTCRPRFFGAFADADEAAALRRRGGRADRREGRRPRGRQGRLHLPRRSTRREDADRADHARAASSATPARGSSSRSSSTARSCRSWRSPTATRSLPLASSQDHKRVFDGDRGAEHRRHGRLLARAGGDAGAARRTSCEDVMEPVVRGLAAPRHRATPGVLYAGLMVQRRARRRCSSSTCASAIRSARC